MREPADASRDQKQRLTLQAEETGIRALRLNDAQVTQLVISLILTAVAHSLFRPFVIPMNITVCLGLTFSFQDLNGSC